MDKSELVGGWHKPEVAQAQKELILRELQDPLGVAPYKHFLRAMVEIGLEQLRGRTLLDAGCGCGHYGVLCERYYPCITYHGTDASAAMIEEARQLAPLGIYDVCRFEDNDFSSPDIILVSQTMETTDDVWRSLDLLLDNARGIVILNRLRLTDFESHQIEEGTYCGNIGKNFLWNLNELLARVRVSCKSVSVLEWDGEYQATMIVYKEKAQEKSVGCSCSDSSCCTGQCR